MKKIIMVIALLWPTFSFAQNEDRSVFQKFENWQSVLNAAKSSRKKIFIDAYTTWCGPCKAMDQQVYPNKNIVKYLDSNFISVKVQMDRTKKDIPEIRSWYSDAASLAYTYKIKAFPSYIFLTADGHLIQINKGFQEVNDFLLILKSANESKTDFTTQIIKFESGNVPNEALISLALQANDYGFDTLALNIARSYKKNFFDKQEVSDLLKPGIADAMIVNFFSLLSLKDPVIKTLYRSPEIADSAYRPGISQEWFDFFVIKDIVDKQVVPYRDNLKVGTPEWQKIKRQITKKYDRATADRIVLNQQVFYYHQKKDWENAIKYEMEKIESKNMNAKELSNYGINNIMFNLVFQRSNNPEYIKRAIAYMEAILTIRPEWPGWIDTYANLLYKSGKQELAIQHEERALELAKKMNNSSAAAEFADNLKKMRSNLPTWPLIQE